MEKKKKFWLFNAYIFEGREFDTILLWYQLLASWFLRRVSAGANNDFILSDTFSVRTMLKLR